MIDPMSIDCPATTCRAKAHMRCTTSTDKVRTSMHSVRYLASLEGPLVHCPKGSCEDCHWSTWIEVSKLVKDLGNPEEEPRPSFDRVITSLEELKSGGDKHGDFVEGVDSAIHRVAQEYNLASTSHKLIQQLRKLGNEYGPMGVAKTAAELTDKTILIKHLTGGWLAPTDVVWGPENPTYDPNVAPEGMPIIINSPVADPVGLANEIIDRAIQIRENYVATRDAIRKNI